MHHAEIVLLPGDGIGPEVVAVAHAVLSQVASQRGLRLNFSQHLIGGAAIDRHGTALPAETLAACKSADAIVLGAVGGPKWSDPRAKVRPEQGLLALRSELGLFANIRPVVPHARALQHSPIRPERLTGVDLVVVRELTGGLYFGQQSRGADWAEDTCRYSVAEIERVVRRACEIARARSRYLVSVDKANVLETSRLWREVTTRVVREEFPEIRLEHQLVDSMAMLLVTRPRQFDVIVTENLFGDILTDEAAVLAGSLGLLPSASLGAGRRGLYEPIHGSAPDIAGQGIANPVGTVLSAAMLLRHSLDLPEEARAVEAAVVECLERGPVTADLAGDAPSASTAQFGAAIQDSLDHRLRHCAAA